MHKIFFLLLLFPLSIFAQVDSIKYRQLQEEFKILDNKVSEVKRDQLNYSLEKDLLKETYSNNYERINMFLTIVLGIFGFLSFLGIRDLNSIKKEYKEELEKLRKLQADIASKSKEFDESKKKYDKEIMDIIKQNEEQNNKIKVLELKEKVTELFKQKSYDNALEYCVVALEIAPNDVHFLRTKAQIYTRTKNYEESLKNYTKILEIEPNNSTAIFDLAELYLFIKNETKSDELIKKHSGLFDAKSEGQLLEFFELIKLFNAGNSGSLKQKIQDKIDKTDLKNRKKRFDGWDVADAISYVHAQVDSQQRTFLLNYLWYLDGQLNGKDALERIGIKVEEEKAK